MDPHKLPADLPLFDPASFDRSVIYDDDEPLELESVAIGSAEVRALAGTSVSLWRCRIAGADLSTMRICGMRESLVVESKLRGTTFLKYVRDVVFEASVLSECVLRMMQLERVLFTGCQLAACDFYGSDLRKVSFPNSSFQGVGFDQCTVSDLDLSEATDLQIGDPRTLAGVSMRETQVPLIALRLAELSGIEIIEG